MPNSSNFVGIYRSIREEYWAHWEKKLYEERNEAFSWIDADRLESEARRVGIEVMKWLEAGV